MKKMLRKKLALMLANLKKKRPYYCELEFLESTGTQYIDTGFIFSNSSHTYKWDIGAQAVNTSNANYNWFCGFFEVSAYSVGTYADTTTSYNFYSVGTYYQNGQVITTPLTSGDKYGIIRNVFTITNFAGTLPVILFGRNQSNGIKCEATKKIFYYKIYDNDTLVRDFIPVLDWNYVPCMYDKVTGQFFYNQGTGDFSYGREIHYVDYLEADGTQYINTGYSFVKSTDEIELNYMITEFGSGYSWGFGSLESGSTYGFSGINSTNGCRFTYGTTTSNFSLDTQSTTQHYLVMNDDGMYNDNVQVKDGSGVTINGTWNNYLYALSYNASGGVSYYAKERIWRYKHKRNGSYLRDMYPAIDENGVGFMFDRVSHTIYDNAGTGVFSYPARETEYTGNDGTAAYIDLGAKYKPSMSIDGKYTRDNYGTNGSVMLLTTTTTAPLIYLPALSGYTAERYVWRRPPYTEQSYFISTITYPFTCEMKVDAVNDTLTLNGDVVKTGMIAGMNGYDSPYESSSNMYMFSIAGSYAGDGKVYYLKITDGTTPVFDLVPAYKDGSAGFYNKVDGTFFKNASTNTSTYLVAGKIVEPEYE